MEKLYSDTQYAEAAISANEQGQFLYRYQHVVEYEAEGLLLEVIVKMLKQICKKICRAVY